MKKSAHCQCYLWVPPEELLETMPDGKPWKRYKKDQENNKLEEENLAALKDIVAKEDEADMIADMALEVALLSERTEEKARAREKELEEKARKEAKKNKIHMYFILRL